MTDPHKYNGAFMSANGLTVHGGDIALHVVDDTLRYVLLGDILQDGDADIVAWIDEQPGPNNVKWGALRGVHPEKQMQVANIGLNHTLAAFKQHLHEESLAKLQAGHNKKEWPSYKRKCALRRAAAEGIMRLRCSQQRMTIEQSDAYVKAKLHDDPRVISEGNHLALQMGFVLTAMQEAGFAVIESKLLPPGIVDYTLEMEEPC